MWKFIKELFGFGKEEVKPTKKRKKTRKEKKKEKMIQEFLDEMHNDKSIFPDSENRIYRPLW